MTDKELKMVYLYPYILGFFRIGLTVILLFSNFLSIPLRLLQVLSLIGYIESLIAYRLYSNKVPVVGILIPIVGHYLIAAAFTKRLFIGGLVFFLVIDVLYVILLTVKSASFPFVIDGEDEEDYSEMEV